MSIIEVSSTGLDEFKDIGRDRILGMFRDMLRIRFFEERVEELFLVRGLLVGPAHLYFGQEAIAVGVCSSINPDDVVLSNHRGHGHALAKGIPAKYVMAELFGKATGTCKGLGGSMHVCMYPKLGALYSSAIVGSNIPIAVGVGFALRNTGRIAVCFFGDGAVNTGAFHEGLNMASYLKVPVLFVCENNQYAISMKASRGVAARSIAERVSYGYNMLCYVVDGNDVLSVYKASLEASSRVRGGMGPVFLECRTYRMKGHGVYDKAEYRDKSEYAEWAGRDPIVLLKNRLLQSNMLSPKEISDIEDEVRREIDEAELFAQNSQVLEFSELYSFVYG
jgi:TPP-dependent pyruvate/acetoin dehydrogenase alpha subunit